MTRSASESDLWLRGFHDAPTAAVRLVCFPHAGGSASFYFPLSQVLHGSADVVAVQYPGRQDRRTEECLTTVTELADAITEALLPTIDRPVALFGHSMGASLAFEVTIRLERRSVEPVALFVSGRRAPSRFREEHIHLLDDDAFLAQIRLLNGTDAPAFQDEEIMRMVLPAMRGDFRAVATYRFSDAVIRTPIHVHTGDSDPMAEIDDVRAWATHTTGRFTLATYPGGHFYLNAHAERLADVIARELRAS